MLNIDENDGTAVALYYTFSISEIDGEYYYYYLNIVNAYLFVSSCTENSFHLIKLL